MKILILSGSGRYQDRWHDFTATSVEVARVLGRMTSDVAVRSFKPQGVAEVGVADLLVVNAGAGRYDEVSDGSEDDWVEAFASLRDYRARGGPILALHSAANSVQGLDEWVHWIGGRWDPDTSMHPPIGDARVQVARPQHPGAQRPIAQHPIAQHPIAQHPITEGLTDFTVHDELYSYLEVDPESQVLLKHTFEGRDHPLAWAVERDGARAVYDALGHDVRSFSSPERVDLLVREASWLTAQVPAATGGARA